MSGTLGNVETVAHWPPVRMDNNQVHPGADRILQPLRDGEWWNVAESNAAPSVMAIHRKPAHRRPKGCARGEKTTGFSTRDRKACP